ncbi:142_t:CDS:2 [Ambispora leptoticha]|uniref:142_t:CDS:1 n=1 Tax=Ambispora leptoticha TaxID=144679 RepID=A0A9N9FK54_9GLOM|nr:142_t:CDS:2 [Ambispora leptoticha]
MPKNNNLIPIEKQKLVEEVVNKSGSNYVSERGKEGYGPMPVDRQALMIAGSHSIMSRIRSDFPNVARLLDEMPEATLGFLSEKMLLVLFQEKEPFQFLVLTQIIIVKLDLLRERSIIVGGVNPRSFEADKNGSYEHASFWGSPEIKLLILDLYELRRLEEKCERVGIEEAKSYIREINRLKAENEKLKNNQNLTNSEKQERLQKNQQKLEKLSSYYDAGFQSSSQPNNSNDKFPTSWVQEITLQNNMPKQNNLVPIEAKKPLNNPNNTLLEYQPLPKSRQQIYQENYQKNRELKKQQRRERYQQQKEQQQLTTKQQSAKYYGAEAFKILMTFKEYTELNCQAAIKEGLGDIVAIMKLAQEADNLIRDY